MRSTSAKVPVVEQLSMPGIPMPERAGADASWENVQPGQEVLYLGKVNGGPPYGAHGVVKQALGRTAVVDMGHSGTWRIPYYFLTVPLEAF